MNYFESWTKHSETVENENDYKAYISKYYELEKNAYDAILKKYPDNEDLLNGKAVELTSLELKIVGLGFLHYVLF